MPPDWSFNLLEFPRLSTGPSSKAKSISVGVVPAATSQPQFSVTASPSRRTSIGLPALTYGRLHLLGLPAEVRVGIWRAVHYDILLGSEECWFQPPLTAWDALQLTCRQTHLEIADFWPCAILPQAKIDTAFTHVLSIELLENFRRLSLELPFSKGRDLFESLALSLSGLASVLQDLRLFFIGSDKFNVKTFVHGCGLPGQKRRTSSPKLTLDGQYQHELQPIFFVLFFLERLRTLVIRNANYPLLQSMIIKHKPQLENLHISTDPRAILHAKHDLEGKLQLIIPPKENYPPVKVLHISANAAITALQVAAKVSRTLEEVDWILPDASNQWYTWNWLEQTTVMLDHFGTYASNLRTLRICLHAPLYEAHYSEASLICGLKDHLPRLTSLQTLELHIYSKADFSGKEIIFAIPDSLKRLYVSDKLISPEKLEDLIIKRYLWSDSKVERDDAFEGRTMETLVIKDNEGWPATAPQNRASPNTGFNPPPVQEHDSTRQGHWMKRKGKWVFIRTDEIIGETRIRRDFIPYRHGKLGFIGYEYDGHGELCRCNNCDEAKLIMFRLNGRLLDRERNDHLACFDGGLQISPRTRRDAGLKPREECEPTVLSSLDDSAAGKIQELWKFVAEMAKIDENGPQIGDNRKGCHQAAEEEVRKKLWREHIEVRKEEFTMEEVKKLEQEGFEQIMDSFDARQYGKNNHYYGYFGTEDKALEHFEKEITVTDWEVPERKWPDDELVDYKKHWLSGA